MISQRTAAQSVRRVARGRACAACATHVGVNCRVATFATHARRACNVRGRRNLSHGVAHMPYRTGGHLLEDQLMLVRVDRVAFSVNSR